jgi:hypothetical protein
MSAASLPTPHNIFGNVGKTQVLEPEALPTLVLDALQDQVNQP